MCENFSYRYMMAQIESKYKFPEKIVIFGEVVNRKNTEMKILRLSLA